MPLKSRRSTWCHRCVDFVDGALVVSNDAVVVSPGTLLGASFR